MLIGHSEPALKVSVLKFLEMAKQVHLQQRLGDGEDGFDVVVVGFGYGGSIAACRLSLAGIQVHLIEKSRRWEGHDFPTDSLKIMSTVRMENWNLGVSFGPKDALFQVTLYSYILSLPCCSSILHYHESKDLIMLYP